MANPGLRFRQQNKCSNQPDPNSAEWNPGKIPKSTSRTPPSARHSPTLRLHCENIQYNLALKRKKPESTQQMRRCKRPTPKFSQSPTPQRQDQADCSTHPAARIPAQNLKIQKQFFLDRKINRRTKTSVDLK